MSTTTRTLIGTVIASAALTALAAPVQAGGAQHAVYVEDYDDIVRISASENPCGAWRGSFHEVRHGAYKIVQAPGGQIDGEYHVTGAVDGWFAFDPDSDGPLPTYIGTYREKANGIFFGEDGERVGKYRLRSVARSADGGTLTLVSRGKLTVNGKGRVVTDREMETCTIA